MNPPRSKNYPEFNKINILYDYIEKHDKVIVSYGVFLNDFNWSMEDFFTEVVEKLGFRLSTEFKKDYPKAKYVVGKDLENYMHVWELFSE